MTPITIRSATAADVPFLWDMLFESAFTTDEARAAWRSDPQPPPELVKYLDGWGRRGDAGVVALGDGRTPVGAAWYRLFDAADRGRLSASRRTESRKQRAEVRHGGLCSLLSGVCVRRGAIRDRVA